MLSEFNEDMDIIAALSDTPGLAASELKAKFDEGGRAIKQYINDTLVPAINDMQEVVDGVDDSLAAIPAVSDSLSSSDASKALSAKQGKVLNDALSAAVSRISSLESDAGSMTTLINGKQKKITYGTSDPSGGASGDIYIKY